jgi:hypothetical protein
MTVPYRKDDADTEELTTADLARRNRVVEVSPTEAIEEGRAKPARSEHTVVTNPPGATDSRPIPIAEASPLFPDDQLQDLKAHWDKIQTGFVDEPRSAVEEADALVASTMQQLASAFAKERANLEQQWDRGDHVSTEDLRVAFQRYRSFFRRLLSL